MDISVPTFVYERLTFVLSLRCYIYVPASSFLLLHVFMLLTLSYTVYPSHVFLFSPTHPSLLTFSLHSPPTPRARSLSKDDVVIVIDKSDNDWWQVRNSSTDQVGLFPRVFLQLLL